MEPAPRTVETVDSAGRRARVPLTVLAGFLGSGKTTLLNRILAGSHGLKIAVLVNDFGSINIDSRLIVSRDADVITLENGCVCCSVRADIVAQLTALLEGPSRPDHVLIETSGVADPGRLLVALRDHHLRVLSRIDGVITLVDVAAVQEIQPALWEIVRRQLASADVIVFNKVDLVSAQELEDLHGRLSYPTARIVETSFGEIPLEVALGIHSRAGETAAEGVGSGLTSPVIDHGDVFATWSWSCARPLSYEPVRAVLATLPSDVFRAKGFLHLVEAPEQRVVANVVGRRVDMRPHGTWGGAEPCSELVFIGLGPGVDPIHLNELLAATVTKVATRSRERG